MTTEQFDMSFIVISCSSHHDKDLLCRGADSLFSFLRFAGVRNTESDIVGFVCRVAAAFVNSVQRLLLTAAQLDAGELLTPGDCHEQIWQASMTRDGTDVLHGLEVNVVVCHELAWDQWLQCKAILISLNLHAFRRTVLWMFDTNMLCRALSTTG